MLVFSIPIRAARARFVSTSAAAAMASTAMVSPAPILSRSGMPFSLPVSLLAAGTNARSYSGISAMEVSNSKVASEAGGTRREPTRASIAMPCSTDIELTCAVPV
ncbi:hypothetical protein EE612_036386 [Oryza sativa]|nr:hypothetical protein EE612_036386 [Oryza sativa]